MESDQTELRGPDLRVGIEIESLPLGEPFEAHLAGEQVVLVRTEDEVFAIGSSCTHYGGPLGQGLVTGDTIRCPWHHACFSLRTGEAVGAPALDPVTRWEVEVRSGRVHLREKREPASLEDFGRSAVGPESVVIVGAGAAGSAAAEMLRRFGYGGPVTLVDPDEDAPYDRPNLSKDYLAGSAPEEWIPLRPPGFHADHGIQRVVARVDSLDVPGRCLRLSHGRTLEFGALLLATGSRPIRPRLPGADRPNAHVLRSLDDCRRIIEAAKQAERVVILGASFIGMESAAALRARGLAVTVVAPERVPFERILGELLGRRLQIVHEANGVEFVLGRSAAGITADGIVLDDGTTLEADLVLLGVGVAPEVGLAVEAGLAVEDGVIVDERLETSEKGIYAAGDIARYPDPRTGSRIRVEHWVTAQRQGQAAARSILGGGGPFVDPPFFWTRQWEVGISYVGYASRWDRVRVEGDPGTGDARVDFLLDGRTLAVGTIGRDRDSLEAERAMELESSSVAPTVERAP